MSIQIGFSLVNADVACPNKHCYFDLRCRSDLVLKTSAFPARPTGKLCYQLSPARFLTYRGTLWEVKWWVSGENGQMLQGRGLRSHFRKSLVCTRMRVLWSPEEGFNQQHVQTSDFLFYFFWGG
ncbi:hypothetical protein, partial [Thiolapillus sp.]|uniref:hypothetical protein n=1 Tax=Thiolapillus sp. TaxID=2017437 RepID=UPI003AF62AED